MKTDRAGFCLKTPVFRFSGLTVPKRPKIAKNDPKLRQFDVFLENGSRDFRNFWHEVRGPKLRKHYGNGFGPKTPVLENSGPTTRFGTKKSNFFKHRHVTPRWKTWGFRITKKIFLVKFGLLGRNLGPKWAKKGHVGSKFSKKNFFSKNLDPKLAFWTQISAQKAKMDSK